MLPPTACLLTDACGNPVSPYDQGAIVYASPLSRGENLWSVATEGFVAVFAGRRRASPPIPFCIISPFHLTSPEGSSISFQLKSFHSWADSDPCCSTENGQLKLLLSIETIVSSRKCGNLIIPMVSPDLSPVGRACIFAERICDFARIRSESCIRCRNAAMRAEVSQYCTIADGTKRTFRDSDELEQYGGCGILSPVEITYFNVFVNGVLQPKNNYILQKGELTFTTPDVPSNGQTVMILFVAWKDATSRAADAIEWQFSTISNGFQKKFTDSDQLPDYADCGIPSPTEVSFFNLYVNGVLQPAVNYRVRKGVLELMTEDAPTKGAYVILESVVIRDPDGGLFRVDNTSFNAYSNGGKLYTDRDEIREYGKTGILPPKESSCQNLFVNSVLQPHVNYFVEKGCLILQTEDSPTVCAPITLQTITARPPEPCPCCKTQLSDAALAEWKKVFPGACSDDSPTHDPYPPKTCANRG